MGRTFKSNDRWKKDKRDRHFQESKKFRHFKHDYKHGSKPGRISKPENPVVEDTVERLEGNS